MRHALGRRVGSLLIHREAYEGNMRGVGEEYGKSNVQITKTKYYEGNYALCFLFLLVRRQRLPSYLLVLFLALLGLKSEV